MKKLYNRTYLSIVVINAGQIEQHIQHIHFVFVGKRRVMKAVGGSEKLWFMGCLEMPLHLATWPASFLWQKEASQTLSIRGKQEQATEEVDTFLQCSGEESDSFMLVLFYQFCSFVSTSKKYGTFLIPVKEQYLRI